MPDETKLNIWLTGRKVPGSSDEEMRVQLSGDPVLVTKMLRTAMQARQDIAAAFIASVVDYAQEAGFNCGDLSRIVQRPNGGR